MYIYSYIYIYIAIYVVIDIYSYIVFTRLLPAEGNVAELLACEAGLLPYWLLVKLGNKGR